MAVTLPVAVAPTRVIVPIVVVPPVTPPLMNVMVSPLAVTVVSQSQNIAHGGANEPVAVTPPPSMMVPVAILPSTIVIEPPVAVTLLRSVIIGGSGIGKPPLNAAPAGEQGVQVPARHSSGTVHSVAPAQHGSPSQPQGGGHSPLVPVQNSRGSRPPHRLERHAVPTGAKRSGGHVAAAVQTSGTSQTLLARRQVSPGPPGSVMQAPPTQRPTAHVPAVALVQSTVHPPQLVSPSSDASQPFATSVSQSAQRASHVDTLHTPAVHRPTPCSGEHASSHMPQW